MPQRIEIRNWLTKNYRLPIGIYRLTKIDGGTLRDDVAVAWKKAIVDIESKGGMLVPSSLQFKSIPIQVRH